MEEKISAFRTSQVMISGNFEVYHYREPYFKSLDFHTHDFYEAYLFLDGSVTYYVEEHAYDLCAGDLLVIPPGKMHRPVISNTAAYERMVLWINTGYLRALSPEGGLLAALSAFGGERGCLVSLSGEERAFAISLLDRLIRSGRESCPAAELYQRSLIASFLCSACEAFSRRTLPLPAREEQELIPTVLRYINEHFTEPISLDELCARFFISKFYLIRKFKEYTNATLYDYILSKRIGLARRLIRQGVASTLVSQQCGFSDYSNFYKVFTAKTGMTPARFKARKDG